MTTPTRPAEAVGVLEQLLVLAEATTPGPWNAYGSPKFGEVESAVTDEDGTLPVIVDGLRTSAEDAAFIAAARTAVPAIRQLLDALRAATARLADIEAEREGERLADMHTAADLRAIIDERDDLRERLRAAEGETKNAQNEAATVRRAYLHEKARADAAGAPHPYTGPVSAERVERDLRTRLHAAEAQVQRLTARGAEQE